jgi:membrane protein
MASKRFPRLIKILSGAAANAEDEVFQLEGRVERFVHFWALVIRQFIRNRSFVRASALSYSTLIALIPLLAVALGVTGSLLKGQDEAQFQHVVEKMVAAITPPASVDTNFSAVAAPGSNSVALVITNITAVTNLAGVVETETNIAPAPVVTVSAQKEIASKIWSFVQNTQSGTLGATGVVLLVFVAVSLLGRIEGTFNDIWGVNRGRNWLHQMQLYPTAIMLGPLLLITALGLAGGAHFQSVKNFVTHTPFVGKLIFDLLPLLVLWLAFALVYLLLPNTKVKFSAAFLGGAVAGTLWHLNSAFGFLYVSRVVTNSKIYGSIGLVPVFMMGVYFSWVILLFGAQVAYAFQNRSAYLLTRLADNVNQRGREFVALRLMTSLGRRFQSGQRPATIFQLSAELGIPSPLTQSVLRTLAHTRLVMEVAGVETAFVPARPLDAINAYDILLAMRTGTGQDLPRCEEPELAGIYGEFARIEKAERETASAISLLDLTNRLPAPAALPESGNRRSPKQLAPTRPASETGKSDAERPDDADGQ